MRRPAFKSAWMAFLAIRKPVGDVGKLIGGYVQRNIEMPLGGFRNACPIRMSYVLNRTGFPIPKSAQYLTVSGADRMQYIYRLADMMRYLNAIFGKPDRTVKSPRPVDFAGLKGIMAVQGQGWDNASGHVTLRNGVQCADTCHLMRDPDNGPFIPQTASIWKLQ